MFLSIRWMEVQQLLKNLFGSWAAQCPIFFPLSLLICLSVVWFYGMRERVYQSLFTESSCLMLLETGLMRAASVTQARLEQKLGDNSEFIIETTFILHTVNWLDVNVESLMSGALNADTLSSVKGEDSGSDVTAVTSGFIKSVQTAASSAKCARS